MTASLYQSGSAIALRVVLEVLFARHPVAQPQDVRGDRVRIELDVVPLPLPHEARLRQEVVDGERFVLIDTELAERQMEYPRLGVVRIEVDDADDQVRSVVAALRIGD